VEILADQHERLQQRVLLEEATQDGAREVGALFGLADEGPRERALRDLEPEEHAQQRRHLGDAAVAEHPLQLGAEARQGLGGVGGLVDAEALPQERADERAWGRDLPLGLAQPRRRRPHHARRGRRERGQPLVDEPRLAHPERADDGDDLGRLEPCCALERLVQRRELRRAPDQPRRTQTTTPTRRLFHRNYLCRYYGRVQIPNRDRRPAAGNRQQGIWTAGCPLPVAGLLSPVGFS